MIWQIKQHTPQPVNSTAYRFTKTHNYVQYWTSPKQVTLYQPAITYSATHILLTSLPKNHFPSWVRDCTTVETRHHPTHAYSWAATPHIMVRRQRRIIEPLDQVRHAKFNIIALSTLALFAYVSSPALAALCRGLHLFALAAVHVYQLKLRPPVDTQRTTTSGTTYYTS